ncbi:hypothetical protein [Alkaliphilus sp. B6464]|nr:hypothetical protein [Alkaliphilus sp. B6464]QUH22173.1 hypothetical protein HYG84_19895 [Alkaliphilus sp. B6464]
MTKNTLSSQCVFIINDSWLCHLLSVDESYHEPYYESYGYLLFEHETDES